MANNPYNRYRSYRDMAANLGRSVANPAYAIGQAVQEEVPGSLVDQVRGVGDVMSNPAYSIGETLGRVDALLDDRKAEGNKVVPSLGAKPAGNDMAARPGTASSAPVSSMAEVPPSYFAEGPTPVAEYPGLSVSGLPTTDQRGVLGRSSLPSHPLADFMPKTVGEAEGQAQAQAYLDQKYGNPEKGSEWQDVENWKGERRKAEAASREAELDPLRYAAKKADLEQQIKDPTGVLEYNEALKAIPPDYMAGKIASLKLQIQREKLPMPTDAELQSMAQSDWLEEYGIFKRNKAGRYEPPPQLLLGS